MVSSSDCSYCVRLSVLKYVEALSWWRTFSEWLLEGNSKSGCGLDEHLDKISRHVSLNLFRYFTTVL